MIKTLDEDARCHCFLGRVAAFLRPNVTVLPLVTVREHRYARLVTYLHTEYMVYFASWCPSTATRRAAHPDLMLPLGAIHAYC